MMHDDKAEGRGKVGEQDIVSCLSLNHLDVSLEQIAVAGVIGDIHLDRLPAPHI